MHPAKSIILFSTLSGMGFGAMVWLGLAGPAALGWFFSYFMAFALAAGGLISSTLHLGRPERAWRALSQWRSSWLSREGIAAIAALAVNGLFAAAVIFAGWIAWPLGWLGAALAVVTVFTTSMIYAQLRTVPRWRHWSVPALYIAAGLAGGALLTGWADMALLFLVLGAIMQVVQWIVGDGALARSGTTLGTATGLGDRGTVRAFEPPHTGPNYLTREMVHVVARKHARALRILALAFAWLLPILLVMTPVPMLLTAAIHLGGLMVSRWLFFAEAEHVVGLYYGAHAPGTPPPPMLQRGHA